jgi:dephospho-CoA kinase
MKDRLSVAVTGGIGSGKSLVMDILRKSGYTTFSCDAIYRDLSFNKEYLLKLKEIFPFAINDKGELERRRLAEIVFNDEKELKQLNDLAHPWIFKILKENIEKEKGIVFSEVPLLFESGAEKDFDYVIIVDRKKSERVSAVCMRDGVQKESVENRMNNQFDYENSLQVFLERENFFILENNLGIEDLRTKIEKIINQIKQS